MTSLTFELAKFLLRKRSEIIERNKNNTLNEWYYGCMFCTDEFLNADDLNKHFDKEHSVKNFKAFLKEYEHESKTI